MEAIRHAISYWLIMGMLVNGILFGTGAMRVYMEDSPPETMEQKIDSAISLFLSLLWWTITWPKILAIYLKR